MVKGLSTKKGSMHLYWTIMGAVVAIVAVGFTVGLVATVAEKGTGVQFSTIPGVSTFANIIDNGLKGTFGLSLQPASNKPTATTGTGTTVVVTSSGQTVTQQSTSQDVAQLQFSLVNAITIATITTGTTDFTVWDWNGGNPNWLSPAEKGTTINSAPEQSAQYFSPGQELVIQVRSQADPTGGTDYYDDWYYVKLNVGEKVRHLDVSLGSNTAQIGPIARFAGTTYTTDIYGRFTDGQDQTIAYSGSQGQTRYWELKKLGVWPRATAANTDVSLRWSATTMTSLTDGASWDDTQAEQDADVTLSTRSEDFYLTINLGATSLAWGRAMYYIDSAGRINLYPSVIIFSTNATAIGQGVLANEGWTRLPSGTTGDVQFGKVAKPVQGTQTSAGSGSVKIPIDANALAASTAFDAAIWMQDFQSWSAIKTDARATSTSIPTTYGTNGYGLAAIIFARAYTETSGNPATMVLFGDWTTPA